MKVFDFELEDRVYKIYCAVCGHQVASCLLESFFPTTLRKGSTVSIPFSLITFVIWIYECVILNNTIRISSQFLFVLWICTDWKHSHSIAVFSLPVPIITAIHDCTSSIFRWTSHRFPQRFKLPVYFHKKERKSAERVCITARHIRLALPEPAKAPGNILDHAEPEYI